MESEEAANTDGEKKAAGACTACHRRKLKCDRMPVCSNCRKSDLPCVYTAHTNKSRQASTTRDGRRKPRGPYQKGRTVREKELENIVEILQEKCALLETQINPPGRPSPESSYSSVTVSQLGHGLSPKHALDMPQQRTSSHSPPRNTNADSNVHPTPAQILELWVVYTSMIDPLQKILHVPTFSAEVLDASRHPSSLTPEIEALLFSIYLVATNVLEPADAISRFARSKDALMSLYSTELTRIVILADEKGQVTFKMLQALVIYMGCLRRQPGPGTNIDTLFSLAVRSARALGLDNAATYATLSPLEGELRRRTWWTICRHESGYAEEIHTRKQSIMHSTDIPLPLNLDDLDLDAVMTHMPVPRVGITSMSFPLVMMEVVRMVGKLSSLVHIRSERPEATQNAPPKCLKEQSRLLVEDTRARIELGILHHCDVSRPFDWFLLLISKLVLTKVQIIMLECPPEVDFTAINTFHDVKVALSLDIIECHQLILKEEKFRMWQWSYRNTQQWYATTYVLEEVGRRPDAAFATRVWQVIDIVFADMNLLNKHGMKAGDRTKLLEAHGKAIEARENLLKCRDATRYPSNEQAPEGGFNKSVREIGLANQPIPVRPEPWQIDQSLFDVQEAELVDLEDAFFWPS